MLRILIAKYIRTELALPLMLTTYLAEVAPLIWLVSNGRVAFNALNGTIVLPLGLMVVLLMFFRNSFGPSKHKTRSSYQ